MWKNTERTSRKLRIVHGDVMDQPNTCRECNSRRVVKGINCQEILSLEVYNRCFRFGDRTEFLSKTPEVKLKIGKPKSCVSVAQVKKYFVNWDICPCRISYALRKSAISEHSRVLLVRFHIPLDRTVYKIGSR